MNTRQEHNLIRAVMEFQDAELVEAMLNAGANPNTCSEEAETSVLAIAATLNDGSCVEVLLRYGADVHIGNIKGSTPLHHASTFQAAKALVEAGADIHAVDDFGATPLYNSVLRSEAETARLLLERGADPHAENHKTQTPAELAKFFGGAIQVPFAEHEAKEKARSESLALLIKQKMDGARRPSRTGI